MDWLTLVIVEIAFVRVRGEFQRVRALPQIEKSSAAGSRNGSANLFAIRSLAAEMPFADVIGGIARGAQSLRESGCVFRQRDAVFPHAVIPGIPAGEHAGPRRRAHRLIAKRIAEENTPAR